MPFNYDANKNGEVIKKCLMAMYIRYRKKVPDHFEAEVSYALKDFRGFSEGDIKQAFGMAYSHYDDKMPLVKDIVKLWKNAKNGKTNEAQSCGVCSDGLVSVDVEGEGKSVCCRCVCALGDSYPKNIMRHNSNKRIRRRKEQLTTVNSYDSRIM